MRAGFDVILVAIILHLVVGVGVLGLASESAVEMVFSKMLFVIGTVPALKQSKMVIGMMVIENWLNELAVKLLVVVVVVALRPMTLVSKFVFVMHLLLKTVKLLFQPFEKVMSLLERVKRCFVMT
jgi:hypothetical protein